MSRRQSSFAYAALLVGVLTFASSFARPIVGQQTVPAEAVVGRYQISTGSTSSTHFVYVIDTLTGKIWRAYFSTNPENTQWDVMTPLPIAK